MLDFRIETFITVCQYMNFTKAAHALHITQPAVSQQIHYLEEHYQCKLFIQQNRKLLLTAAGKALLSASLTMSNDEKKLSAKIQYLNKMNQPIIFGATLTIGEYLLPYHIADYVKTYGDASLTFFIQDTKTLLKKLDHGDIDFAFVEGYFPKDDYDYITWKKEKLIPVCSYDHPLLKKDKVTLSDLLTVPLIIREKGSGTRDTLEHFLACENISIDDFHTTIEVGGVEAIKTLVKLNTGITFLYESAFSHEYHHHQLAMIPLVQDFSNEFSFIWRKNSIYSKEYIAFFNMLINSKKDT